MYVGINEAPSAEKAKQHGRGGDFRRYKGYIASSCNGKAHYIEHKKVQVRAK